MIPRCPEPTSRLSWAWAAREFLFPRPTSASEETVQLKCTCFGVSQTWSETLAESSCVIREMCSPTSQSLRQRLWGEKCKTKQIRAADGTPFVECLLSIQEAACGWLPKATKPRTVVCTCDPSTAEVESCGPHKFMVISPVRSKPD